jgi:FdhD protein
LPLTGFILVVSGRASFEIVQKAWLAGIPIVAAVSAPSTLAVDLAMEAGVTLAAFVRGHTFNLYAHPGRIV